MAIDGENRAAKAPADATSGAIAIARAPEESWLRSPMATRLGVILLFVLIWEFGARIYNDPDFMAPATQSFVSLLEIVQDSEVSTPE